MYPKEEFSLYGSFCGGGYHFPTLSTGTSSVESALQDTLNYRREDPRKRAKVIDLYTIQEREWYVGLSDEEMFRFTPSYLFSVV